MSDDWYCPKCERYVGPASVTHEEAHDICGVPVLGASPFERIAELEAGLRLAQSTRDQAQQEVIESQAELAALKAENERLKVCGNCGNLRHFEYQGYVCSLDGMSGGPIERCEEFFEPSRWTARDGGES